MKFTAKNITWLACTIIVSLSYLWVNRYEVISTDKGINIFNVVTGSMAVYSKSGKLIASGKDSALNPASDISVSLKRDPKNNCSAEFPFLLEVRNRSQDTLLAMTFKVDAREKESSRSLLLPGNVSITGGTLWFDDPAVFDSVLPPGFVGSSCYKFSNMTKKLKENPEVKLEDVEFAIFDIKYGFLNHPGDLDGVRKRFGK